MLEKLSLSINRGVEFLLFGFGLSMAIIIAVQVFARYALNNSIFWSEELARFLLIWLTFLGATAVFRRKAHPGIDVLYTRMPPAMRKFAEIATHCAGMGLFGVMIIHGCRFTWFVREQISPALHLPKWVIMGIIPISGIIFMIHGINFLMDDFRGNGPDN